MAKRKIALIEGEFYHIFNRGNSKQTIFLDHKDYERFIQLLYVCNSKRNINFREDIKRIHVSPWEFDRGEPIVSVGAWVLMPNHFHLYITILDGHQLPIKNNISLFMEKLTKAYSKYFNKKYNRTGSLFEGKFKSVHIKTDVQAKYLFSYQHTNPLKLFQKDWKESGLINKPEALTFLNSYKWSSFLDYKGILRNENSILDRKNFLNYFPSSMDFEKEIFDWLKIDAEIF